MKASPVAITLICSGCKTRLTVGEDRAGTTFPCPRCTSAITVSVLTSPQAEPSHRPVPPPLPSPPPRPNPAPKAAIEPPPEPKPPPSPKQKPKARTRRRKQERTRSLLAVIAAIMGSVLFLFVLVCGGGLYWVTRDSARSTNPSSVSPSVEREEPDDVREWFARNSPHTRIVRMEYLPVKGTRRVLLGDLGDDFVYAAKLNDHKAGRGPLPPPPPKRKPPGRIDGAYLVVLEWQMAGERGREKWCVLRKEGGGVEMAWDLSPGDNWKKLAAELVAPD